MIRPGSWLHTAAIVAITFGVILVVNGVTAMVGAPYPARVAAVVTAGVAAALWLCLGTRIMVAWWGWRGRRRGYYRTRGE